MKHIKKTAALVKEVLEQCPETRSSDDLLYMMVCTRINNIAVNLPFAKVMSRREELHLPPYESVRRNRQKFQELHPELRATDVVSGHRAVNEEIVKEYVKDTLA